jgi:6-phosphogluconolactonase (cycloisomerase 2 family)
MTCQYIKLRQTGTWWRFLHLRLHLPSGLTRWRLPPNGGFAYVVDFLNSDVSIYSISPDGLLTSKGRVAAGQGSISVTVDITGRFALVANNTEHTATRYKIDAATGD